MTSRFLPVLLGMFALTIVSGCSVLPERPAKATFMLPAPDIQQTSDHPIALTLRVLRPHSESPLEGTRILVNPNAQAIKAYAGAKWSKPTPVLIRDHWIDGMRQHGGFKAVVNETSAALSDLSLASDLTRFHIQYHRGQATVFIQLDAQLLDSRSRKIVAAKRFDVEQPIDDQPIDRVIAGFGRANQTLTEKLVAWSVSVSRGIHGETDPARPPSDIESSTTE
jgi:cholesterol transport system auxiliary component